MFLTKECDYAIRVVRSLSDQQMKSVRLICQEEHMPLPFAYKILKKLEHARIVKSYRGATGGYRMQRGPETVTLLDILRAVDDHLFINECLQAGYVCDKNRYGNPCRVHEEFNRLQGLLMGALSEKTMRELV